MGNNETVHSKWGELRRLVRGKTSTTKHCHGTISRWIPFKKKKLHLVNAAKLLTEKFLGINNCQTETNFSIDSKKIEKINNEFKDIFKIAIGA